LTEARVDGGVLAFSLLAALAASLVCGLLPALTSARADLRGALDEGGRSGSAARPRLQRTLVAAEVALSLVLLAGAGLLVKSFLRLQRVDPGFAGNALALDLSLAGGHGDLPARAQLYEQIVARMEALPGVRSAGITTDLPLSGETSRRSFSIVGGGGALGETKHDSEIRRVSTRYFDAMGMAIRRGRAFAHGETGTAIVNEAMVRTFLGGHDAIGRRLVIEDGPLRSREIVGVVADVKHFALDAAAPPEIYLSHIDRPWANMTLVVRPVEGEAAALVPGIRRELALVDKNLPAANVKAVAQYLSGSVARQRFSMRLLVLFAAAAVLLAALGIYGVVAYAVAQRTPEIGIRMALGADGGDVARMVLGDGWRSVRIGIAAGLAASMLIAQAMTRWLYDVSPADPWVFGGVTLLLAAIALLASWLPARRAARVDPMVCVRS
jgi:putative ABC transport system permease protein